MKGQEALMSSARTGVKERDGWRTPQWLFDRCVKEFGPMQVDAAASRENHLCPSFFSEEHSALSSNTKWPDNVWCNPPYSMLKQFAIKALEQLEQGCQSVTFLIPARTDTKAFQMLAHHATYIVFLAGRVKFEPGTQSSPFPSALIYLTQNKPKLQCTFEDWRPRNFTVITGPGVINV